MLLLSVTRKLLNFVATTGSRFGGDEFPYRIGLVKSEYYFHIFNRSNYVVLYFFDVYKPPVLVAGFTESEMAVVARGGP